MIFQRKINCEIILRLFSNHPEILLVILYCKIISELQKIDYLGDFLTRKSHTKSHRNNLFGIMNAFLLQMKRVQFQSPSDPEVRSSSLPAGVLSCTCDRGRY